MYTAVPLREWHLWKKILCVWVGGVGHGCLYQPPCWSPDRAQSDLCVNGQSPDMFKYYRTIMLEILQQINSSYLVTLQRTNDHFQRLGKLLETYLCPFRCNTGSHFMTVMIPPSSQNMSYSEFCRLLCP